MLQKIFELWKTSLASREPDAFGDSRGLVQITVQLWMGCTNSHKLSGSAWDLSFPDRKWQQSLHFSSLQGLARLNSREDYKVLPGKWGPKKPLDTWTSQLLWRASKSTYEYTPCSLPLPILVSEKVSRYLWKNIWQSRMSFRSTLEQAWAQRSLHSSEWISKLRETSLHTSCTRLSKTTSNANGS